MMGVSHIDPVANAVAALFASCLDILSQLLHKALFPRDMNMSVEHPAIRVVVRLVKRHRIMAQDHMLLAVCDFLVVLDILKELLYRRAELFRVMISSDQDLLTGKRSKVIRPYKLSSVGRLCPSSQ